MTAQWRPLGGFIVGNDVLILGTLTFGLVISVGMNAALVVHVMRMSKDLSESVEGLSVAARWLELSTRKPEEKQ